MGPVLGGHRPFSVNSSQAGHATESEAGLCETWRRERVEALLLAAWPTLQSLTFGLGYPGDTAS